MTTTADSLQTIARLTPLAEVLALIDRDVRPVSPRRMTLAEAARATLAEEVVAAACPAAPLALIDGWALEAELTRDAGGYAPAPLPRVPVRLEVGQPLPDGADSVAPVDVVTVKNGRAEVLAPVAAGDGVLPAGGDCDGKVALRRAGKQLRAVDLAILAAAGLTQVSARVPHLSVLAMRDDTILDAAARLIANDAARLGAVCEHIRGDLSEALAGDTDAAIAIGGTGSGRNDDSVHMLARSGRVAVHGVGIAPGETAAFGSAGDKPVLLLPGRFDAALAVWLTLGRRLLQRLSAATSGEPSEIVTLSRKVASTVGVAEVVPLRRSGDMAEPLAAKYLSLTALARADGWLLLPAESEGYSAGSRVPLRPWP